MNSIFKPPLAHPVLTDRLTGSEFLFFYAATLPHLPLAISRDFSRTAIIIQSLCRDGDAGGSGVKGAAFSRRPA